VLNCNSKEHIMNKNNRIHNKMKIMMKNKIDKSRKDKDKLIEKKINNKIKKVNLEINDP